MTSDIYHVPHAPVFLRLVLAASGMLFIYGGPMLVYRAFSTVNKMFGMAPQDAILAGMFGSALTVVALICFKIAIRGR